MEITLLGTGSAEGWPSPFCRCASCRDAAAHGLIRGQTAALVDDSLLVDCGPEAPRAAVRHGRTLAGVRHILFTHAHPDHFGPQALLFRSWIDTGDELEVIGPTEVLDACRPWVGPADPVRFTAVRAGDRITAGRYGITVLPARHRAVRAGDTVLYDIRAPDGASMLWACDTGPWPAPWFDALRGAAYDAVFLEETFGDRGDLSDQHLGLTEFADMLAGLRAVGAVTAETDVVGVHLGHHNPPNDELERRLHAYGARPGRDGELVYAGKGVRPKGNHRLVLGGARSGKSRHAEDLLAGYPAVTYVATGGTRDGDPEWAQRVARHRERRPDSWTTRETGDVAGALATADCPLLIDCLGTWLTGRLDAHRVWEGADLAPVRADIEDLLTAWRACAVPVVAVSNEVGSGVVPASASGRLFRDLLGTLNSQVAAVSDSVDLVVAGIAVPLR